MEKISIVIPIYNMEKYIRECLDSLISQTYTNIELICVDDGSKDNTLLMLREYEKQDDRIKVITGINAGPGAARNKGLELATGDYISILDADDVYLPTMLEEMYREIKATDSEIAICRSSGFDDTTKKNQDLSWSLQLNKLPQNAFSPQDIKDNVFLFCVGWAWDKLYDAKLIKREGLRFQEIRNSDDAYFVYISLVKAKRICIIDNVLVNHRLKVSGSTSRNRNSAISCFFSAIMAIERELKRSKQYLKYNKAFINWALHYILWNLNTIDQETYPLLLHFVVTECLTRYKFQDYSAEYFYNKNEYEQMISLINKVVPIPINIHGSCVSRETINTAIDKYHVVNNIQRNSIVGFFDKGHPLDSTSVQAHNWERRMVQYDFEKKACSVLKTGNVKAMLIDFIDERFDITDILKDGVHFKITNSQILMSSFRNVYQTIDYNKTMWTVVPRTSIPIEMLESAALKYCEFLKTTYGEERIIIFEAYFVNKYLDKNGALNLFDRETIMRHQLYNKGIKAMYDIVKKILPNAHYIKFPRGTIADESHKWGISGVHYIEKYYKYAETKLYKSLKKICKTS